MATCRFRSSFGGDQHCADPVYQEGFCRFHFDCFLAGEISQNGEINEQLADQVRRRTINFHGISLPDRVYLSE